MEQKGITDDARKDALAMADKIKSFPVADRNRPATDAG